jgi:hypothetical protein
MCAVFAVMLRIAERSSFLGEFGANPESFTQIPIPLAEKAFNKFLLS